MQGLWKLCWRQQCLTRVGVRDVLAPEIMVGDTEKVGVNLLSKTYLKLFNFLLLFYHDLGHPCIVIGRALVHVNLKGRAGEVILRQKLFQTSRNYQICLLDGGRLSLLWLLINVLQSTLSTLKAVKSSCKVILKTFTLEATVARFGNRIRLWQTVQRLQLDHIQEKKKLWQINNLENIDPTIAVVSFATCPVEWIKWWSWFLNSRVS